MFPIFFSGQFLFQNKNLIYFPPNPILSWLLMEAIKPNHLEKTNLDRHLKDPRQTHAIIRREPIQPKKSVRLDRILLLEK